jgi:hypothetical protein
MFSSHSEIDMKRSAASKPRLQVVANNRPITGILRTRILDAARDCDSPRDIAKRFGVTEFRVKAAIAEELEFATRIRAHLSVTVPAEMARVLNEAVREVESDVRERAA